MLYPSYVLNIFKKSCFKLSSNLFYILKYIFYIKQDKVYLFDLDDKYKKELTDLSKDELLDKIKFNDDERIFTIVEWFRKGYDMETIINITKIDPFFLYHLCHILEILKPAVFF
mgnify:CR=1 FL=1